MKSKTTAYLLWLPGLIGLCGLHHFYLGRTVKGVVWLLTLGILGIGQMIDLFTLGGDVERCNQRQELDTLRTTSMQQMARNAQDDREISSDPSA
jgi:TM2 domain-containing membrane protein YozV